MGLACLLLMNGKDGIHHITHVFSYVNQSWFKGLLSPVQKQTEKNKKLTDKLFWKSYLRGWKKIWVDYLETGSISFTCLKLSITKVMQSCFAKNRWCQSINRKLFNCSRNGPDYLKIHGKRYLSICRKNYFFTHHICPFFQKQFLYFFLRPVVLSFYPSTFFIKNWKKIGTNT